MNVGPLQRFGLLGILLTITPKKKTVKSAADKQDTLARAVASGSLEAAAPAAKSAKKVAAKTTTGEASNREADPKKLIDLKIK